MITAENLKDTSTYEMHTKMWDAEIVKQEEFLAQIITQHTQYTQQIEKISTYLDQKLYYECSEEVYVFLKEANELDYLQKMMFFDSIITPLQRDISPLQYVNILCYVIYTAEPAIALWFLDKHKNIVKKFEEIDATMIFTSAQAYHNAKDGKRKVADETLEKISNQFNFDMNLDLSVYTSYHRAKMEINLVGNQHADYCKNATLFFSYTPLDTISKTEKIEIALQLVISALIAEKMYNFGDILQLSPVNDDLKNSENGWIVDLLVIFDDGDINKYAEIIDIHQTEMKELGLSQHSEKMNKKITILALMNFAFQQPKSERVIPFQKIADHCKVVPDKVEELLMKAMSYKLIEGQIDEVEKVAIVKWVKPRILDAQRLDLMKKRMENWAASAEKLQKHIEMLTGELLA